MASLLAYVAPERLAALFGDGVRTTGRVVPLRRSDLPGQLERLDAQSTLFLITVERGQAVVVATLEDPGEGELVGEVTLHDHDITELLVRLGCDKVWLVPEWATIPRIVPPNDVDLLRYTLGLALLEPSNLSSSVGTPALAPARFVDSAETGGTDPAVVIAPAVVMLPPGPDPWPGIFNAAQPVRAQPVRAQPVRVQSTYVDPTARTIASLPVAEVANALTVKELLAAVYANPASDLPRRAYAARLRVLGDDRAELIDLQLDRCRAGGPITQREHDLVGLHRDACVGSLRPLLMTLELSRGFLSKCLIGERMHVSPALADDPAWGTVEDIACADIDLLTSPRLSARTARIRGRDFGELTEYAGLLPFETLLPYPAVRHTVFRPEDGDPHGIILDPANLSRWPSVLDGGALMRVRALKLDALLLGARIPDLLASKLGRRLAHLDVWIDPRDTTHWRAAFERAVLPMLTLRAEATTGQRFGEGDVCISLERTAGQPRVIVERAPDAIGLHMVREIGHDLREIEVSTPELFARLRPLFTSVTLVPRTSLAL